MVQPPIVLPLVFVPLVLGIIPIDISINQSPAVISAPNSFLPISLETSSPNLQTDRIADTFSQERNKIIIELLADLLKIFLGGIIGIFLIEKIREKQENHRNVLKLIEPIIKPRAKFRVTQLCDPQKPFDFFNILKEQNRISSIVIFEIDDFRIFFKSNDILELQSLDKKKEFTDKLGEILARMKGTNWLGLSDRFPEKSLKIYRDLIITNIPIPGNFYCWNSKDRKFLIISTTSVSHLFLQREDNLSLENFIVRMAQRMTVFAVCPNLNPMATHSGAATGCLFDFTIVLEQVIDVVKTPFICPTCAEIIRKDQGAEFLKRLHDWLQSPA